MLATLYTRSRGRSAVSNYVCNACITFDAVSQADHEAWQFFQSADFPVAEQPAQFSSRDFPEIWTCLPFMVSMKYAEFNAEKSTPQDTRLHNSHHKNQFSHIVAFVPTGGTTFFTMSLTPAHIAAAAFTIRETVVVSPLSQKFRFCSALTIAVFLIYPMMEVCSQAVFPPPTQIHHRPSRKFPNHQGLEQPVIA